MRSGLWRTGSGGSGILIARKSDGTWSPPSGIMLHTPTLSFIIGVDIYDCVLIINSLSALESITRPHVVLGEDVGLSNGALVPLDTPDSEINIKDLGNTVMTYLKARGQAQRVNLHGCILTERANENEQFYGSPVSQMEILSGNISRHVEETQPLIEVIKLAEGRTDFDAALIAKIAKEPAPGDAVIATPSSTPASPRLVFGQPSADDPDPFGILALEMAGLEIREAGSQLRPTSSQLDFHTRPISQLSRLQRQSGDTYVSRSNRESGMSTRTVKSQGTDAYTQTDVARTPETSPSPGRSEDGQVRTSFERVKIKNGDDEEEDIDYTTVDLTALKHLSHPAPSQDTPGESATTDISKDSTRLGPPSHYDENDRESKASSAYGSNYGDDEEPERNGAEVKASKDVDDDDEEDDESDEEEPVVFEVATVQTTSTQAMASRMVQAKGSMVTIPKRLPPPLPTRNPARASLASRSDLASDASSLRSPLRQTFSEADLNTTEEKPRTSTGSENGITSNGERAQSPLPSALRTEVPRIEEPELDTPKSEISQAAISQPPTAPVTETKVLAEDSPKTNSSNDSVSAEAEPKVQEPSVPSSPKDVVEHSSPKKKERPSIDTGVTDDTSSVEESYTTPTSERRLSFPDDGEDTTPKNKEEKKDISSKDASKDDTPIKLPKDQLQTDEQGDDTDGVKATPAANMSTT